MTGSAAYPPLLVTRPTALVAGRAVTGNLQTSDGVGEYFGYYDEWSYSARAGQHVVITMDSEDVDAYLVVLRDDGTEVASDDDGGTDYNARVEFEAPATGQYTILATSFLGEDTGRYTLRVERSPGGEGEGARAMSPWASGQLTSVADWTPMGPGRALEAVACN